jgi:hypothetical protein
VNGYARLSAIKRLSAGMVGNHGLDAVYLDDSDSQSRDFDGRVGRHFYTKHETRYGWGPGWLYGIDPATECITKRIVSLPFDVISLATLKVDLDDDGTFETTLVDGTDYRLGPDGAEWKRHIELLRSGEISAWEQRSRFAELAGAFGYSAEWKATGLTGTLSSSSDTSLTASDVAGTLIEPGDTLQMGTEQLYVSAVSGVTVTVERGVNGSTAATQTTVAISVRRYPRDVEDIIAKRVVQGRIETNQLMPMGEAGRADFAAYMDVVDRYTPAAVRFA